MKKALPIIVVIVAIAVIVAIVLGGNNNSNNNSTNPPSSSSSSQNSNNSSNTPQATNSVSIINESYSPADITVKKGATVTWTNNDNMAHTVTADSTNSFDSGTLEKGKTFSFTFNDAGTFKYHCNFHSDMHGTVTVTE